MKDMQDASFVLRCFCPLRFLSSWIDGRHTQTTVFTRHSHSKSRLKELQRKHYWLCNQQMTWKSLHCRAVLYFCICHYQLLMFHQNFYQAQVLTVKCHLTYGEVPTWTWHLWVISLLLKNMVADLSRRQTISTRSTYVKWHLYFLLYVTASLLFLCPSPSEMNAIFFSSQSSLDLWLNLQLNFKAYKIWYMHINVARFLFLTHVGGGLCSSAYPYSSCWLVVFQQHQLLKLKQQNCNRFESNYFEICPVAGQWNAFIPLRIYNTYT